MIQPPKYRCIIFLLILLLFATGCSKEPEGYKIEVSSAQTQWCTCAESYQSSPSELEVKYRDRKGSVLSIWYCEPFEEMETVAQTICRNEMLKAERHIDAQQLRCGTLCLLLSATLAHDKVIGSWILNKEKTRAHRRFASPSGKQMFALIARMSVEFTGSKMIKTLRGVPQTTAYEIINQSDARVVIQRLTPPLRNITITLLDANNIQVKEDSVVPFFFSRKN